MKKLLSILLILVLVLGSAALADAASYRGLWFMESVHTDGETMRVREMGVICPLNLNWDGSADLDMLGELLELCWEEDAGGAYAFVPGTDSRIPLRLEGGVLLMEMNGAAFTFSRTIPEGYSRIPPVAQNAVLEDYLGSWVLESLTNEYGIYSAQEMLTEMVLIISDGSFAIELYGDFNSGTCHMDGSALVLEELDCSVLICTDGNLYVEDGSEVMKYVPLTAENAPVGSSLP